MKKKNTEAALKDKTEFIINYLKPRITDVIQHNSFVSSDMSSTTTDDVIHLNLKYERTYVIIVDSTEYPFYDYIDDRFGMDYNKEELDHFITSLYYQKNDMLIIVMESADYSFRLNDI